MKVTCSLAVIITIAGSTANAQTCGVAGTDAAIGRISAATYYSPHAWSVGFDISNLGTAVQSVAHGTSDHPAVTSNLYRLKTVDGSARFEQIGMGWVFHAFFGLENGSVCICSPVGGGNIGPGCTDNESSSIAGSRDVLGPRFEINAWTGAFPFPFADPPFGPDARARRLQASEDDVNPALNQGATYFVENHVVSTDDSGAGNMNNNASYRRCAFPAGTAMTLADTTVRAQSAIHAWKASDPSVVESRAQVPGEGHFIVAAKATDLGNGTWHYEYAVYNMNSHRSARTFSVPLPAGAVNTNIGFHDVDYHSGDGLDSLNVDGTDWAFSISNSVTWSTQTFAENENANALRWGTLYNFRFDSNAAPTEGNVTLGLYRPGNGDTVTATGLPIPGTPPCTADFDGDGFITGADFDLYVQAFEAGDTSADFDGDGFITGADYDLYVQAYEEGC